MSMVSLSSAREASAAQRMTWSAGTSPALNGSPSVSLFCVRVPVLSAHSTSIPANSSMATSRLTIASFRASRRAPTAIVTDNTVGIATGIAATVSTKANCSVVTIGSPRKIATAIITRHQCHREDDQIIANLQHRALEVADGLHLLHQLRGFAEVGVRAGGIDQCAAFALANDRTGEDRFASFARGGQRLSRQRRLIDLDRIARQQACIGRHNVAQAESNDVARHQLARGRGDPLSIASHPGFDRQPGLQRGDGVTRLALFPKSDHGVANQQQQDDAKIRPVLGHGREDHRRFDHPGDGPPKVAEELEQHDWSSFLQSHSARIGPAVSAPRPD